VIRVSDQVDDAEDRLEPRLAAAIVDVFVYVFGGAAMALAYDSRRATRDVDALFKPHGCRSLTGILLEVAVDAGRPLRAGEFAATEDPNDMTIPTGPPYNQVIPYA
jgi:hypothetical protein